MTSLPTQVRVYTLARPTRSRAAPAAPSPSSSIPDAGERELVLEHDGRFLDLSGYLAESKWPGTVIELASIGFFERGSLEGLLASDELRETRALYEGLDRELDVPIEQALVGKILALGKNFREHAAEFGEAVPETPLFFGKLPETLLPHGATLTVPAWYGGRFDHEAELAVVIGKPGKDIVASRAYEHVAGYAVANDLTARTLQGELRQRGHPWFAAKNMDGACPLGPCFVPRDYLDVSDLAITARVNGELRQEARTRDFVVSVPEALAHLSRHLTLRAGDIVLMGTPAGVSPLSDGDTVVCAIEGIGELATVIARPRSPSLG